MLLNLQRPVEMPVVLLAPSHTAVVVARCLDHSSTASLGTIFQREAIRGHRLAAVVHRPGKAIEVVAVPGYHPAVGRNCRFVVKRDGRSPACQGRTRAMPRLLCGRWAWLGQSTIAC